jgi:RHS repeat-associated protein
LYYYGARYYDPAIGRFISADAIVPDPMNPQSLQPTPVAIIINL